MQGQGLEPDCILDTVDEIRDCKQKCGQEMQALKTYLDDINYYSQLKLEGCMKGSPPEGTL